VYRLVFDRKARDVPRFTDSTSESASYLDKEFRLAVFGLRMSVASVLNRNCSFCPNRTRPVLEF
jgi:hypothetical protein